jgi:cytochrome c biogenesis protein CcmG/thiol:disulfide interchange protein DsbE
VQFVRNKTDLALKLALVAITIALCVVVAGTMEPKVVGQGDRAPNFSIATDQGRTISPANFGSKLLVLNFWATWCAPCLQELPSLDQFARQYESKGITVLAISVDQNEKRYRDMLARVKPAFLTARDASTDIAGSYGTFLYPETYIIDQSGKVVYKEAAARDWMDPTFLNYIQSLL